MLHQGAPLGVEEGKMIYSVEDFFRYSGQFDKTVCVSFWPNSIAYRKYGDMVVGKIHYDQKERLRLEEAISNSIEDRSDGLVRLNAFRSPYLSSEQKNQLFSDGFFASETSKVLCIAAESTENSYRRTDNRQLPDPIVIEVDFSKIDSEALFINRVSRILEDGKKLIPQERNEFNGIVLRRYEGQKEADELLNESHTWSKQTKEAVRFEYLKSKYNHGRLNESEQKELEEKFRELRKSRMSIVSKELKRCSADLKKLNLNYDDALRILISISLEFRPRRLNSGKFPVWLDYERFVHIYMRHVSETQIGERFREKTVFQYGIQDIERLIEMVLNSMEYDIETHFNSTPDKDFVRGGRMSIYFNGDYYQIRINSRGKLMQFHKLSTPR